jgi:hypothetical protein
LLVLLVSYIVAGIETIQQQQQQQKQQQQQTPLGRSR